MPDFKLAKRITWYNTMFALLACLALALSSSFLLKRYVMRSAQIELHKAASAVAQTMDPFAPLQNVLRIRTANRTVGVDIVWVSPAGRIQASNSRSFPAGALVTVPLKDSSKMNFRERWYLQDSQHVYALAEIDRSGEALGFIMAVAPVKEVGAITRGIMSIFIPVSIVVALASSLLGGIWTRKISMPVLQLAKAAHGIAEGNFGSVPRIAGDDEIAELAGALRSMAEQLQAGEQAQREFVQNASHELKTPLMNIQGYAEALRDGLYTGDEANQCLEIIGRETVRMRRLVDDMIYLSTITAKSERLNREDINLVDLLQAVEESSRGIAVDSRLTLLVEVPPEGQITGDFDKLVRALTNLIANAARYARSKIEVKARLEDGAVVIEVRDDGPGVEQGLGERVFERFTRGKGGQTGLGLAIVKAIIEAHGGSISVVNDRGAVFKMKLALSSFERGFSPRN